MQPKLSESETAEQPAQVEPAVPTPEGADAAKPAPAAPAESQTPEQRARTARRASEAERKRNERALKKAAKLADPAERHRVLVEAGMIPAVATMVTGVPPPGAVPGGMVVPPEPIATPPAPDAPEAAPDAEPSEAAQEAALVQIIEGLSTAELAEVLVGVVDENATSYDARLELRPSQRVMLSKALAPVLAKYGKEKKLTPEDALVIAALVCYAPKILPIIGEKIRARRGARA